MDTQQQVVAAFDFDGTVTYSDTMLHFLLFAAGPVTTIMRLIQEVPSVAAWGMGFGTRQSAKEGVIKRFFAGKQIDEIRRLGEAFAQTKLLQHVRPEAKQRLDWHRKQGHRCVLISASLDVYLDPWARVEGFDEVISSRLETTEEGMITGKLIGANCWGPEKKRRLLEKLGSREKYTLYAYGDSRGDKELLEMADYPFFREMPKGEVLDEQTV